MTADEEAIQVLTSAIANQEEAIRTLCESIRILTAGFAAVSAGLKDLQTHIDRLKDLQPHIERRRISSIYDLSARRT